MPDNALRTPKLLSIVAPVYDEEELIEKFVVRACAAAADFEFEPASSTPPATSSR
jgi:hypothetical protein